MARKPSPTVTVTLDADDLYFIWDSIAMNVPGDEGKSPAERRTSAKIVRAQERLLGKDTSHD